MTVGVVAGSRAGKGRLPGDGRFAAFFGRVV